jgi:FkbM family methyltransferase
LIGLILAKIFAQCYWVYRGLTHKNLPGLGRALDLIKSEYILGVRGEKFIFDPRVGRAYGLMIIGQWNEPETHTFLKYVLAGIDGEVNFVNVGASIGEFIVDMATYDKVAVVIAFEPQPESANAIEKSCALNGFQNVRVIQKIVTDRKGCLFFFQDKRSPTASHVVNSKASDSMGKQMITDIPGTTLDEELKGIVGKTIILIDIEGGEHLAMQGGAGFIRRWKPLLIFEYNSTSRALFDLNMVRDLLGPDYVVFRMRPDGSIDRDETHTWNMVAVAKSSGFFNAVYSLRYGE